MNRRRSTQLLGAAAMAALASPLSAAASPRRPWRRQLDLPTAVIQHLDHFADQVEAGLSGRPQAADLVRSLVTPVRIKKYNNEGTQYFFRYQNKQGQMITLSRKKEEAITYIH